MNAITPTLKKTPLVQVSSVKQLLMNAEARDQLAMVAAKHLHPERMMRVVANATRTTPKLAECDPMSLLGALMQCASLGLEPNTVLGHAYLIPFDKKAKDQKTGRWEVVRTDVQLIIGYRGLIDLARRSGHIVSISANVHYSDDELWTYEEGTEATLRHRPGPQDGKKLHAYAIAKLKDGGHAYVVLPWAKVMKIRDGSEGWKQAVRTGKTDKSPWQTHEDAMAMKTAVRALAKFLPLSVEFADAMNVDERPADFGAFALNPAEGVTIDGEISDDGDTGAEMIEEKRSVEEAAPPKREPAPRQQKRDPAPRGRTVYNDPPKEDRREAPVQQQREPEPEQEARSGREFEADAAPVEEASADPAPDRRSFDALFDMICSNLFDGSPPDDERKTYATELAQMKEHFPDIYARLEAEFKDAGNTVAKRKRLTKRQRLDVHAAAGGLCHICGEPINLAKEKMEVEHVIPFALGGADDTSNWRPAHVHCHAEKTKTDITAIAKAKRVNRKHTGTFRPSRNPVPGSTGSKFRKLMNGAVIDRATGREVRPPRNTGRNQ